MEKRLKEVIDMEKRLKEKEIYFYKLLVKIVNDTKFS